MENTKEIPLFLIKELREKTLIGIKECKNALILSCGDIDKAERYLKETGRLKVNSRIRRPCRNGLIFTYQDSEKFSVVLQTCESESVTMNKIFRSTGTKLAETVALNRSTLISDEMNNLLKDAMTVFRENMSLRELIFWNIGENEYLGKYTHNEGEIVSAVKIRMEEKACQKSPFLEEFCADLAMQVCAANPIFIERKSVDSDYLKKTEDLFREQSPDIENISEEMKEKIINGKLTKHLNSVCLMDQPFIKNNKKTIKQILEEVAEKTGSIPEVSNFIRIKV